MALSVNIKELSPLKKGQVTNEETNKQINQNIIQKNKFEFSFSKRRVLN
jgi:hypothetical protein